VEAAPFKGGTTVTERWRAVFPSSGATESRRRAPTAWKEKGLK